MSRRRVELFYFAFAFLLLLLVGSDYFFLRSFLLDSRRTFLEAAATSYGRNEALLISKVKRAFRGACAVAESSGNFESLESFAADVRKLGLVALVYEANGEKKGFVLPLGYDASRVLREFGGTRSLDFVFTSIGRRGTRAYLVLREGDKRKRGLCVFDAVRFFGIAATRLLGFEVVDSSGRIVFSNLGRIGALVPPVQGFSVEEGYCVYSKKVDVGGTVLYVRAFSPLSLRELLIRQGSILFLLLVLFGVGYLKLRGIEEAYLRRLEVEKERSVVTKLNLVIKSSVKDGEKSVGFALAECVAEFAKARFVAVYRGENKELVGWCFAPENAKNLGKRKGCVEARCFLVSVPERLSIVPRLKRKLDRVFVGVRQLDMAESLTFFTDMNFPDKSLLKENFFSLAVARDFVVFLLGSMKLQDVYALFNPLAEAREVLNAELRRREAERLFEKVFKKSLHGMMIVEKLKIKEVNEALKTMLMYTEDELIGRNPIEFMTDDEKEVALKVYERRKSAGVPVPPREVKFLRKDGSVVVTVLDGVMIDKEREIFVFFLRDVTEEKKQRSRIKELEDTIARATRLNLLGEVASMLFHEIGNPLTSLIISLEVFRKEIDNLEGDERKKLFALWKIMHDKVAYIRLVLKRVRSFVKGKTEVKLGKVDLVKVARDVYNMTKPMFAERGMELKFETHEDEVLVRADVVSVQQVLLNFLTNARQALKKAESIKVATIRVFKRGDMGVVEVEDTGPGIPDEIKEKIFSPMFTTKKDGTGLGLVTSKRLAERMGGDIYFVSEEGLGAKFALALPLWEEREEGGESEQR